MTYWRIYYPEWQEHQPAGVRWAEVVPIGDITPPADDDPGPVKPEPIEPEPITYTIKAGDSWWRIANNHGLTVTQLQAANPAAAARALLPGQVLIIPLVS